MTTAGDMFHVADRLESLDQGATIRWVMHQRFTYLAIKVRGIWYTTATEENTVVGQKLTDSGLAQVLSDQHSEGYSIVTRWEGLPL